MADRHRQTSKFLSLVLRHEPERIGIVLDEAGWVSVHDPGRSDTAFCGNWIKGWPSTFPPVRETGAVRHERQT